MKLYTKHVSDCSNCPGIKYKHYDGEGESSPYEYYNAICVEFNKPLPDNLMTIESKPPRYLTGEIPKRKIPHWCELPEV